MNVKFFSRLLAIFLILALTAGTASAQVPTAADTLAQRSPAEKLSSRLATLAKSSPLREAGTAAQARALSLPERGPGSLMRSGSQILVNVRMTDMSAPALAALTAAGARLVHVSERYQIAAAYIDPADLRDAASLAAVVSLEEEFTPQTGAWRSDANAPAPAQSSMQAPNAACAPLATSEGDTQLKADQARTTYTLNGTGVTIGILSDSFNKNAFASTTAAQDIASGDLPGLTNPCGAVTPINVLSDFDNPVSSDEGRGMLQLVHDLAPGSPLSFATAFINLLSFADNVRALRDTAGADVIADDVFYYREPFFQEGPVNVAISDVVRDGALYFALAGNHNVIDAGGNNISSYEAPAYRPTACPPAITGELDCHNFATSGPADPMAGISLASGGQVNTDLQWAEPWFGVVTDINIYLLDGGGNIVAGSNTNNIDISQNPFELMYYENLGGAADYSVVIARGTGSATPRLKYIFLQGTRGLSAVEYNISAGGDVVGPTLYGHSATTSGISVGAIPFDDSNTPEQFTSRGPATYYFGPVKGLTPAAPIGPTTLNQPDIAATDGGCTTFFGSTYDPGASCYRFYGTSAATPHAAAVAALVLQRARTLNVPMDNSRMKWAMQTSAQAVSGGTAASVGSGLVDALAAAARLDFILTLNQNVYLPAVSH